ncbi:hypothetical protein JHK86_018287 [Glycine max]|nr:hypothetical protein JHK86_018287 [Glycine max]
MIVMKIKHSPTTKHLRKLGVLSWKLDADNHGNDPELKKIHEEHGYTYMDHNDAWIREWVKKGGMIILPVRIYHHFTLDESNYIKFRLHTIVQMTISLQGQIVGIIYYHVATTQESGKKFDVVFTLHHLCARWLVETNAVNATLPKLVLVRREPLLG